MTGPPAFIIATTIDEAVAAAAGGATVVAGGSDLVVGHRQGRASLPNRLVAIDRVPELATIAAAGTNGNGDGLVVGAAVTHARIMADPTIVTDHTALADGSALIGSPATRNVGTIGGNVMNGSPAMDTGAPLVVLGAVFELRSPAGRRSVTPDELWIGPGRTSARSDEVLVACRLPSTPDRSGSAYVRLEYRRAMEIAVVGAAASVTLGDGDVIANMRIAVTAVAPTIVEVPGLDELAGHPVDDALGVDVARRAAASASPISDLRAGDRYRRHCVGVMARRATMAAVGRARGESIPVPANRSSGIGATAGDDAVGTIPAGPEKRS